MCFGPSRKKKKRQQISALKLILSKKKNQQNAPKKSVKIFKMQLNVVLNLGMVAVVVVVVLLCELVALVFLGGLTMHELAKQKLKRYQTAKAYRENWVPLLKSAMNTLPMRESFYMKSWATT